MNILNEVDKPIVKKTVVVYAGRFQPFHKGHYAAYSKLVSKFGKHNVYIGTSNDTSGPKSPFNFNEKKKIATTMFGIPDNHFIQIRNPYKPVEILSKFDGQTTQYIAAVGEKDATRLQGKYFKPYQGKSGYGYDEIGYVFPVPAEKEPISGTDVRNYLGGDDEKKAKDFFLKAYPKFNQNIFDMITDKIKSKQMQSLEEYGARTMGNGMAGDFGPSTVSKMDDEDEITEDGLPGGAFTGLVSPGGYINGAPKPKDVNKLAKKLHKRDDEDTHQKYVYDPIAELIGKKTADLIFNDFILEYFGEDTISEKGRPNTAKPNKNPIMDKDIKYKKADGTEGSIKVGAALRLKKDHPAHIQAVKMLGDTKPQPKEKGAEDTTNKTDKNKEKSDKANGEKKNGEEKPKGPEPEKLSGAELKSDAEKRKEAEKSPESGSSEMDPAIKEKFDKETAKLDGDDKKVAEEGNNPNSPTRKSFWGKVKNVLRKGMHTVATVGTFAVAPWLGVKGATKVAAKITNHVSRFIKKKFNQYKDTAAFLTSVFRKTKDGKRRKAGVIKDKDGNNVHYSDFQKKDENGKPVVHKEPVYQKGKKVTTATDLAFDPNFERDYKGTGFYKHKTKDLYLDGDGERVDGDGNRLDKDGKKIQKTKRGKPVYEEHPVPADNLTPEQHQLFHKSVKASHHQKHAAAHTGIEIAMITGSIFAGGAAVGGIKAAAGGSKVGGVASATLKGGASGFTHGVGGFAHHFGVDLAKHTAGEVMGLDANKAGGAALGHTVLSGVLGESKKSSNLLIESARILENTNEKSDKAVLAAYNFMRELYVQVLKKMETAKLPDDKMLKCLQRYNKLKEQQPKQDLMGFAKGMGINESKKSLDNEIISKSKVKNIADFVGYSTKRLKLKNKPNIKLILGQTYSESNLSLGGYNPETKDIYVVVPKRMTADICRTIAHELVHRKQDEIGIIKNSGTAGKTGSPIENQANAVAGILLRDYGKINKQIYSEGLIVENISDATTSDQPNGAFLPKGHKRVVGANDGVNKSDFWFHNGGYIQLEYPEADSILGDDDANQIYIRYVTKNVPRESGPKTKFTKNAEKAQIINKKNTDYDYTKGALEKVLSEVSKSDLHFKNIYKHWRDSDAKTKQSIAALVTGNKFANQKEFVRELARLTKTEIEEIESVLGIKPEVINEMGRNDIHFKNIFNHWKVGDTKMKKKIGQIVCGDESAKIIDIVKSMREMDHDEIQEVEDEIGIPIKEVYGGAEGGWYGGGAKRWVDDNENDYTDLSKIEDINLDVDKGDEVLMGKFKNKKVQVKDIGKDQHGMPTINGKQATTFRTINESGDVATSFGEDGSFRSPYYKKWEHYDDMGTSHADIIGFTVIGHTSDSFKEKKNGVVLPSDNPTEENGPGKRWIHPSKPKEYHEDKKLKWEMYPFNSRPAAYKPPPDIGDQIDIFKYTKPSVIKENIEEWNNLLLEGGAYGHMSHPFDDMDLTFGDLKDIITKALDGELGVVREKTDGQALAISWKNGRLVAARNKGHLENAGANAMGIEDVASKFAGRGGLTDAYNYAMKDLSAAIAGLSKSQRDKIFDEGKCFMNIEVIWPTSVNVIPYGQALLVFHNTTCYDEKGKAIGADQSAARTLAGMIKQINADVQSKYTIQGPPITSLPKNQNLTSKKSQYLSKLSKLQNEFGLGDSDTVALYHQSWWEDFIDKKAPTKVDKITKDALVKRWAFGDKSFKLNTITNAELVKWAIDTDKINVAKQQKENIKPFEEIFLGVGADILEFVGSVLTVYPDKAIRNMKDRLKATADQVRKAGNPAQIQKLKTELERLNKLGGIDKIVAVEGLVFFYNGKTYKLTGTFAPLNQILGIFYG